MGSKVGMATRRAWSIGSMEMDHRTWCSSGQDRRTAKTKWTYEQKRSWIYNQKGIESSNHWNNLETWARTLWMKKRLGPDETGPCKTPPMYTVLIPQVFIPKDLPLVIQITEYWRKGNVWIFRRLLYTEHVNLMLLPGTQRLSRLLCYNGSIYG